MGGVVRRSFGLGALFAAIARTGWAQGLPRTWATPDDATIRGILKTRIEIFAESPERFFWKVVDAQATFERGPDGQAVAVILRQAGRNQRAQRAPP